MQRSVLDDVGIALVKPDTTGVLLLVMPDFRTSNSSLRLCSVLGIVQNKE